MLRDCGHRGLLRGAGRGGDPAAGPLRRPGQGAQRAAPAHRRGRLRPVPRALPGDHRHPRVLRRAAGRAAPGAAGPAARHRLHHRARASTTRAPCRSGCPGSPSRRSSNWAPRCATCSPTAAPQPDRLRSSVDDAYLADLARAVGRAARRQGRRGAPAVPEEARRRGARPRRAHPRLRPAAALRADRAAGRADRGRAQRRQRRRRRRWTCRDRVGARRRERGRAAAPGAAAPHRQHARLAARCARCRRRRSRRCWPARTRCCSPRPPAARPRPPCSRCCPGWPPRTGAAPRCSTCARSRRCSTTCCPGSSATPLARPPGRAVARRRHRAPPPARSCAERPDILLTTPESLEAMLVSVNVDHAVFFAGVRAVVVDEVHAFAGDDRGWHLLAVLERLSTWSGGRCSGSACPPPSATRRAADLAAGRAPGDRPARVVAPRPVDRLAEPAGTPAAPRRRRRREVELDYVGSLDNAATVIAALHRGEKRLVFCESRRQVEELGAAAARARASPPSCPTPRCPLDERRRSEAGVRRGARLRHRLHQHPGARHRRRRPGPGHPDRRTRAPWRRSCSASAAPAGGRAAAATACSSPSTSRTLLQAAGPAAAVGAGLGGAGRRHRPSRGTSSPSRSWRCACSSTGSATRLWPEWWNGLAPVRPGKRRGRSCGTWSTRATWTATAGCCSSGRRRSCASGAGTSWSMTAVFTAAAAVHRAGRAHRDRPDRPGAAHRGGRGPRRLLLGGRSWQVTYVDWQRRRCFVEPVDSGGKARWTELGVDRAARTRSAGRCARCCSAPTRPVTPDPAGAMTTLPRPANELAATAYPDGTVVTRTGRRGPLVDLGRLPRQRHAGQHSQQHRRPAAGVRRPVRPTAGGPHPRPVAGRDRRRRPATVPARGERQSAGRAEVQRRPAAAAGRGDPGRPARRPAPRRRGAATSRYATCIFDQLPRSALDGRRRLGTKSIMRVDWAVPPSSVCRAQAAPPLTNIVWPLTQRPGPARNATASAMSSGVPKR